MISFTKFGELGRLGNQLFQYAFLRTTAKQLGVKFFCPPWIGDSVFDLKDSGERSVEPQAISHRYMESFDYLGFNENVSQIKDDTDIHGYFQTEKYFCNDVRAWYKFKDSATENIRNQYQNVDFKNSVGISVRLGDFVTTYGHRYYVPARKFYLKALEKTPRSGSVLVFSDDIKGARNLLGDLGTKVDFIEGYEPYEGLYLQSICRDYICSPSTYAWWAAWLNDYEDSVIVAPSEGAFRPGVPIRNQEYWPDRYVKIPALRFGLDHFITYRLLRLAKRGANLARNSLSKT
jgi:hypothetical protein